MLNKDKLLELLELLDEEDMTRFKNRFRDPERVYSVSNEKLVNRLSKNVIKQSIAICTEYIDAKPHLKLNFI